MEVPQMAWRLEKNHQLFQKNAVYIEPLTMSIVRWLCCAPCHFKSKTLQDPMTRFEKGARLSIAINICEWWLLHRFDTMYRSHVAKTVIQCNALHSATALHLNDGFFSSSRLQWLLHNMKYWTVIKQEKIEILFHQISIIIAKKNWFIYEIKKCRASSERVWLPFDFYTISVKYLGPQVKTLPHNIHTFTCLIIITAARRRKTVDGKNVHRNKIEERRKKNDKKKQNRNRKRHYKQQTDIKRQ